MKISKAYFFDYIPFNRNIKLEGNELENQKFIMDLKAYPETFKYDVDWKKVKDLRKKEINIKKASELIERFINEKALEDIVLMVVPSSKVNNQYHGITLAAKLILNNNPEICNGLNTLIRIKDKKEEHLSGKMRDREIHEETIEMNDSISIKGKNVILIDDVLTTGITSDVCIEKILTKEPNSISFIALGKTK